LSRTSQKRTRCYLLLLKGTIGRKRGDGSHTLALTHGHTHTDTRKHADKHVQAHVHNKHTVEEHIMLRLHYILLHFSTPPHLHRHIGPKLLHVAQRLALFQLVPLRTRKIVV